VRRCGALRFRPVWSGDMEMRLGKRVGEEERKMELPDYEFHEDGSGVFNRAALTPENTQRLIDWASNLVIQAKQAKERQWKAAREVQIAEWIACASVGLYHVKRLERWQGSGYGSIQLAGRDIDGLPVFIDIYNDGTSKAKRAFRKVQVGPGPELKGVVVGGHKWRKLDDIDPYQDVREWRLAMPTSAVEKEEK
jgi:hypothetical protein